ncbi:MAG: type 2 isopentenyl-diphosphate Delta-isomerase [Thermoplasmata archaeon]
MTERKRDHVDIVLGKEVRPRHNHWDDVHFLHRALPEIDLEEIDTGVTLFGKRLAAPLIISSMTGGFEDAVRINDNLAYGASKVGVGMGVGSQRPVLQDQAPEDSWTVVEKHSVPLMIANIGAPQLIRQGEKEPLGLEEARRALQMVGGDILAIHFNYTQEIVQPEGDRRARGVLEAVRTIAKELPVLAKETGAGISKEVALQLKEAGVQGIDIGGLGGTSFSAVEFYRAQMEGMEQKERLGEVFWEWGIPSPISLFLSQVGLPVIATGGIRNGLDVAKAVALGSSAAGMASQMLRAAERSAEAVVRELESVITELKAVMFLTGCTDVNRLHETRVMLTGPTKDWANSLGLLGG